MLWNIIEKSKLRVCHLHFNLHALNNFRKSEYCLILKKNSSDNFPSIYYDLSFSVNLLWTIIAILIVYSSKKNNKEYITKIRLWKWINVIILVFILKFYFEVDLDTKDQFSQILLHSAQCPLSLYGSAKSIHHA